MFSSIKMYIYIAVATSLFGTIGYGYTTYKNLQSTIQSQKVEAIELKSRITNRDMAIKVMASNVLEVEKQHKSDIKRAVFTTSESERKKQLEKGFKRDENITVSIDAARFYLYP